jgi:hypothetical protein
LDAGFWGKVGVDQGIIFSAKLFIIFFAKQRYLGDGFFVPTIFPCNPLRRNIPLATLQI